MNERDETAPATVPNDEPDTPPAPCAPDAPPDGADPGEALADDAANVEAADRPVEIGGQKGPEPTRYGDWEGRGRCTDF